jgi:hypothetical protein
MEQKTFYQIDVQEFHFSSCYGYLWGSNFQIAIVVSGPITDWSLKFSFFYVARIPLSPYVVLTIINFVRITSDVGELFFINFDTF